MMSQKDPLQVGSQKVRKVCITSWAKVVIDAYNLLCGLAFQQLYNFFTMQ